MRHSPDETPSEEEGMPREDLFTSHSPGFASREE